MFHIITANFLAVADMADVLPLRAEILLKKFERLVSLKFPIAFAALRRAIFKRFDPLGILWLNIRPPLTLLLGHNRSQLAKCLADSNLWIPSPTSLINVRTVL
jgi:hypothetical protein